MDSKTRDAKGLTPLTTKNNKIDAIVTTTDLATYFGLCNKNGDNIPFSIYVTEDAKDPTKYITGIWQGGLGLPDREYYLLQDKKSKEIRAKYVTHIVGVSRKQKGKRRRKYNYEIGNRTCIKTNEKRRCKRRSSFV